ncbi:helix-turn-helix transcriptional regulator [Antarcticibacterium arcticum]|uniref:Helix-turn-helix transcriptional regulator n=1 Tax=Antarcticibacterium arcticum TaxID=2585771 RepID=A0A5B8YKD4_9FLAO|nr:AraC family transcriptional regulator [Antarcticibacterium arcticum]QED38125.1 helix-turn-helix transcriptional regulator [Antarcticibacterium arcticum]
MKITVKALPIEEIIEDLSRQFNIPIKKDSGEQILELPSQLGEGYIRGTSFDSGIGIIDYNFTFFKDFELLFSVNNTHPLKFIFCSEGRVDHTFEEDHEMNTINTFQNVIVSSSGNNGHILNFKANEKVHVSSIEIIRAKFSHRNNYDFEGLDPVLKEIFRDSQAEKKFFYQGNYSIKAADIVDEINEKKLLGFLRSVFVEGKLYEMLVIQIAQYMDDQREDHLPKILRQKDIENVKKAIEIVKANLDTNLTIDYLANEVGTNVNKLQEGFKYMFELTVNKYMQQLKLEAAKEMLESTDNNISQIVNLIGLNNRSYFSKIFKEKYHVSPKYFLRSTAEKDTPEDEN